MTVTATATRERPIIFSGPMVKAILDGRKTQTRRIVTLNQFQPSTTPGYDWIFRDRRGLWNDYRTSDLIQGHCPYGQPGDQLWVRETWGYAWLDDREYQEAIESGEGPPILYRADYPDGDVPIEERWHPSIHMKRHLSRITLEVTGVKVERLQAISGHDAIEEGVSWAIRQIDDGPRNPREAFRILWDQINGRKPGCAWADSPWVWVIGFRSVEP